MHTTTAQNLAHRADGEWAKSSKAEIDSRIMQVPGHWWVSEYRNGFTDQTIRKSGKMQGQDWFVFDADGEFVTRAHSLTAAKYDAKQAVR